MLNPLIKNGTEYGRTTLKRRDRSPNISEKGKRGSVRETTKRNCEG